MCATQAKKAYAEELREDKSGLLASVDSKLISSDYSSHYNTKLGKCLVLIQSTRSHGKEFSNSRVLIDAFERRVYGYYLWISKEGTKFWEVAPTMCDLTPSMRETNHCNSEEEFKAFVANYMEE
jgi:hypothetical protein